MKSWRTTLIGFVCFGLCVWSIEDNLRREAYNLRYYLPAFALFATGLIGIHARDHKHKD